MVRDFSQKTVQELYETIRVNVDEEEQWKVFEVVEPRFFYGRTGNRRLYQ